MLRTSERPGGAIRPALSDDLPAMVRLCQAHAAFEEAPPPAADLAGQLEWMILDPSPRLRCFVAEHQGELVGYATWAQELSTWTGTDYAHLDCLFVAESRRGEGWGRALFDAVRADAISHGIRELQWQTPAWNTDAIGFYERIGARGRAKIRFVLND